MTAPTPTRALEANIAKLADAIRADAWSAVDTPGWGRSVFVPHSLLVSEAFEEVKVGVSPYRPEVLGELIRVHLDGIADVPTAAIIRSYLRGEIEPFIIGVGEVAVDDTAEGIVIRLTDRGDELGGHNVRSSEITPEMIAAGATILQEVLDEDYALTVGAAQSLTRKVLDACFSVCRDFAGESRQ